VLIRVLRYVYIPPTITFLALVPWYDC